MSPLVVGSARFRVGRWHGDPSTAHIVTLSEAHDITADSLTGLRRRLKRDGFSAAFTSAVGPDVRDALTADGFAEHERLCLLSHDLRDLPEAPGRAVGGRRGRRCHLRGVLAVDREVFEPFWRLDRSGLQESINATPAGRFRVIRRDGAVAAYMVAGSGGTTGFLQRLGVAARHQGKRLGAALTSDALHWVRRRGADSMWVNTQESNEAARAFYRRLGFRPADHQLTVLHRRL